MRVLPIVLTYNSPEGLQGCLAAIGAQTLAPLHTLVVDNASTTDTGSVLADHPDTSCLRLLDNTGPAGGYGAGLRQFLESEADWAWVLDDDCRPVPSCLEALERAAGSRTHAELPPVLIPRSLDVATSKPIIGFGWLGILIPRRAVEQCGGPLEELFYWVEDGEYFFRLQSVGYQLERVGDATVLVHHGRTDTERPAWKYYYMARNTTWARLAPLRTSAHRRPSVRRSAIDLRKCARSVVALAVRAVVRERHERRQKLWAVMRGVNDGLRGRLGRTWIPEDGHRPRYLPDREAASS
jgi:rhamnopyranosyl-N-acetylglucosaminyl-diphospho-decaprenol beta-1,3/1,4-galactofuranosyltransferase